MDTGLLVLIGAIAVLLVLSAFFSGSETALTAASRPRMHRLEQLGNRRAGLVNRLREHREQLIGAILLGNNLVHILASVLATSVLLGLFGKVGLAYATVVMTLLILIFAEVLPKSYAINHADRLALAVAPVLRVIVFVLAPVTHAIQIVVRGTLKLFGSELGAQLSLSAREEELRGAIELHKGSAPEIGQERAMLRSILDLADVDVG